MSKQMLENVFAKTFAEELWTANTSLVMPVTLQDFSLGAVLPAVLFMLRRGRRRGVGRFREVYASPAGRSRRATPSDVAERLLGLAPFRGFEDDHRREVLEDLLIAHLLETKKRSASRNEEVGRVYPTHFFSSWVDLPEKVGNLRFVPELLVVLLANQAEGDEVGEGQDVRFPIGSSPDRNLLIAPFSTGVKFDFNTARLNGDTFDESPQIPLDELLAVRVGRGCGAAPQTAVASNGGKVPNRWPLSRRSANAFREDLAGFVEAFGSEMPRRALTPMLETLIGLGLWHTFLASLRCAVEWERTGKVPEEDEQKPFPVFVDASGGAVADLRRESERSVEEVLALLDEANVAMACVRVISTQVRFNTKLQGLRPKGADPAEWLNLLGRVRRRQVPDGHVVLDVLAEKAELLKQALRGEASTEAAAESRSSQADAAGKSRSDEDICPPAQAALERHGERDPVRALGEALVELMGDRLLRAMYVAFLDSLGMVSDPHGLLKKRKVARTMPDGRRRQTEARSVVLSNELLEALVHTHLVDRDFPLSFAEFLALLRDRYGLCVDEAPPGQEIPQELLLRNRDVLERRLRDLGLLRGVNDAESMKLLRPRYRAQRAVV